MFLLAEIIGATSVSGAGGTGRMTRFGEKYGRLRLSRLICTEVVSGMAHRSPICTEVVRESENWKSAEVFRESVKVRAQESNERKSAESSGKFGVINCEFLSGFNIYSAASSCVAFSSSFAIFSCVSISSCISICRQVRGFESRVSFFATQAKKLL